MSERATTYAELKEAISRAFPALSPQLQRLSRFAMDKPHDLALGTVAAIAQANGVQPSSLIRFANALGFSGFSQMQQVFQSHLVERSAPHAAPYRERIAQMKRGSAGGKVAESPLHRFVAEASLELQQLEEHVDTARLAAAARVLAAAPRIHVLAQRRAFPVACYLAYALAQLELQVQLLDGAGGMLDEFARGIRPGEALLVASFRDYTPVVVEVAQACRARGVSVVAITDSALSPLRPASDICFELGDDSSHPFRSLVGPLCLAQALVVSIGQALAATAAKAAPAVRRKSTKRTGEKSATQRRRSGTGASP